MSIEQLIVLVLFLVIPLIQTLRTALQKKREASQSAQAEESDEPTPDWPPAPEPHVPSPPVYTPPVYTPPVYTPPVYTSSAPSPRPASSAGPPRHQVEQKARQPQPPRRAAVLLSTGLVPRDRQSLRRAMALVAILGPPRSLER